jgi:predicted RNase H-like HicB family nuclease
MENKYTAVIKKDGDWWIGWIEEIPGINCQEMSQGELLETLRITLKEALEMNKKEAIATAESNYSEVVLEI